MGGRGGSSGMSSGAGANKKSVFDLDAKEQEIKSTYTEDARRPWMGSYNDTVLEARDRGNGEVEFVYATPDEREKYHKTNRVQHLTYYLKHGWFNGKTFGINWDNVKSISGKTYAIRPEAKEHGFRWNRDKQRWEKE